MKKTQKTTLRQKNPGIVLSRVLRGGILVGKASSLCFYLLIPFHPHLQKGQLQQQQKKKSNTRFCAFLTFSV